MRMFSSCQNFEERVDVIHLMYDNHLDDLAWALISLISNKKVNLQKLIDDTPINWEFVQAGRTQIKVGQNERKNRNLFGIGQQIKSKIQKTFRKILPGNNYYNLSA